MKIVWAVDPFETHVSIQRAAATAIRSLVGGSNAEVLPIYIWSRPPLALAEPSAEFTTDLRKRGREELTGAIQKIRIPNLARLEVHAVPFSSRREEARELIARAKKSGADLIVVSSHGKKGFKRALLGSFAETLSLTSDIPLFVVRPDSRQLPLKEVFFPTDFSEASIEAFKRVVEFAKPRKSRITIFYKVTLAPFPAFDFPVTAAPPLRKLFAAEAAAMENEGRKLAALAARRGVKARVIIDRSSPGSVSETIVRRARKSNALIALCSRSGPIEGLLLGSTARQVLRLADVPVWVIHPTSRKARKREPVYEVTARDIEHDLYERPA